MSHPPLDEILARIEADASTVDPWETNSSRSTIVGIGASAGKAIMNIGIGILRSMDYVNIRTTLGRISRRQNHRDPGSSSVMEDWMYRGILEYQRYVHRVLILHSLSPEHPLR